MKIGTKVRWTSSNTTKVGEIVAIVPAGKLPIQLGFKKLDNSGLPRDHETYVVVGRKPKHTSHGSIEGAGPKATYWPRVSLLSVIEEFA